MENLFIALIAFVAVGLFSLLKSFLQLFKRT